MQAIRSSQTPAVGIPPPKRAGRPVAVSPVIADWIRLGGLAIQRTRQLIWYGAGNIDACLELSGGRGYTAAADTRAAWYGPSPEGAEGDFVKKVQLVAIERGGGRCGEHARMVAGVLNGMLERGTELGVYAFEGFDHAFCIVGDPDSPPDQHVYVDGWPPCGQASLARDFKWREKRYGPDGEDLLIKKDVFRAGDRPVISSEDIESARSRRTSPEPTESWRDCKFTWIDQYSSCDPAFGTRRPAQIVYGLRPSSPAAAAAAPKGPQVVDPIGFPRPALGRYDGRLQPPPPELRRVGSVSPEPPTDRECPITALLFDGSTDQQVLDAIAEWRPAPAMERFRGASTFVWMIRAGRVRVLEALLKAAFRQSPMDAGTMAELLEAVDRFRPAQRDAVCALVAPLSDGEAIALLDARWGPGMDAVKVRAVAAATGAKAMDPALVHTALLEGSWAADVRSAARAQLSEQHPEIVSGGVRWLLGQLPTTAPDGLARILLVGPHPADRAAAAAAVDNPDVLATAVARDPDRSVAEAALDRLLTLTGPAQDQTLLAQIAGLRDLPAGLRARAFSAITSPSAMEYLAQHGRHPETRLSALESMPPGPIRDDRALDFTTAALGPGKNALRARAVALIDAQETLRGVSSARATPEEIRSLAIVYDPSRTRHARAQAAAKMRTTGVVRVALADRRLGRPLKCTVARGLKARSKTAFHRLTQAERAFAEGAAPYPRGRRGSCPRGDSHGRRTARHRWEPPSR